MRLNFFSFIFKGASFAIFLFIGGACTNGALNSSPFNSSGGSLNLEVPIEMVDYGLQSNTSDIVFERTSTSFNTDDYDGWQNYYFEIVGYNINAGNSYTVNIVDSLSVNRASMTIPANTLNPTRYRIAFSPRSGADTYRVSIPATGAASDVTVLAARIIVQQRGASRTKIYIPMSGYDHLVATSNDSILGYVSNTSSLPYASIAPYSTRWFKNVSAYSQISLWQFEAVLATSNGANTAYATLINKQTLNAVTAAEVGTSSTTATSVIANFPDNSAEFFDGYDFEVGLRATNGGYVSRLYRAGLWVQLINLTRGEVFYRTSRTISATGNFESQRVYYDASQFSWPTTFFETTIFSGSNPISLVDTGTVDQGTTGTNLPGSFMATGSPPLRSRSGVLNLTSGDRFVVSAGGGSTFSNSFIVVRFQQ